MDKRNYKHHSSLSSHKISWKNQKTTKNIQNQTHKHSQMNLSQIAMTNDANNKNFLNSNKMNDTYIIILKNK
jgi:hypothetical protein